MQLTAFTLSALSIGSALAQDMVTTHIVRVGGAGGALTYTPADLTAAAGDMIQFQFMPKNHTVTQSTFDNPCEPSILNSNITGIYSGYMAVAADAELAPTWTIQVKDAKPMWLYCSQGKHCQGGMVMVVNAPAANKSRTLETYKALAAKASVNLPGDAVSGGSSSSIPASSATASASDVVATDIATATGADSSATSTPTSSAGNITNTGAASTLRAGEAMSLGGLVALVFAFLV